MRMQAGRVVLAQHAAGSSPPWGVSARAAAQAHGAGSPHKRANPSPHWLLNPTPTTQEFNLEKLQLLEQEKAKIRKEYERREALVEVKKKM